MDNLDSQGSPAHSRVITSLGRVGSWLSNLDWVKTGLILAPFFFLMAYAVNLVLPVPAFLLPERTYLALHDVGKAVEWSRGKNDAYLVLPDRLVPARTALRASLPDEPILDSLCRDLEAGAGSFHRARLVMDEPPLASELEALEKAAGSVPLAIDVIGDAPRIPIQSLGVRYAPAENRVAFDLLLSPGARAFQRVEVRGKQSVLFRAPGRELPQDLVLRLSADRSEASPLLVSFTDGNGKTFEKTLTLGVESEEKPKVLVVSDKKVGRSFIEALYPARRVTPDEAATLDLLSFELVVIDGIPIGSIRGRLRSGLLDLAERRTGSILFVADSPEFGKKGDNPELEDLLPVTLLPRSLKDLPDLAVLILIDVSGSMFGDKLSLAKVTGLELLRNLKPGDAVGMMLFSDERRWIYRFQPNADIAASPMLEPLTAGGGTDLYPALADGLARLSEQTIKAKHVVLITDGITKPADFQALADQARSNGISISAMGVGTDANRPLLERLALQTSGLYYPVNSVDAIPGLLFEDRMSEARALFGQGKIPVLAMNGERVANIGGMAQYTPVATASVLFTNGVGDPLLAGKEQGNRAVLFFGSDLYGTYTSDFFKAPAAAGAFKDRLDALFARKPAQVKVVETARGISVLAQSHDFTAPVLVASKEGSPVIEVPFQQTGTDTWAAELVLPFHGTWSASILDRGGSLASFHMAANGGLAGVRSDAAGALHSYEPRSFRPVRQPGIWLVLLFISALACTVMLRVKR